MLLLLPFAFATAAKYNIGAAIGCESPTHQTGAHGLWCAAIYHISLAHGDILVNLSLARPNVVLQQVTLSAVQPVPLTKRSLFRRAWLVPVSSTILALLSLACHPS